jgi:hypothetical protein
MCRLNHQHEEGHSSVHSLHCLSGQEFYKLILTSHLNQFERQVRFALSNVSSWRTIDGDFDYEAFWNNVVDFFENVPGPVTKRRVEKLLEWWTR